MSIFTKLSRLISANLNGLLDKAEDPALALQQVVREMNNELVSHRQLTSKAVADYRLIEAEHNKYSALAQQYNGYIIAYISQGQEAQARQATYLRDECFNRANQLAMTAKQLAQNISILKNHLQQLEAKCLEANNRKQELLVKASVAKSQEKLESKDSVFSQFDQLERLISVRSERAIAYSELSTSSRQIAIGNDAEIMVLKAQMGMPSLPPVAPSISAIPPMAQMPAMPEMPDMPSFT